jgi:hypothetical protein
MISANEAMIATEKIHEEARRIAETKYLPFFVDLFDKKVTATAAHGMGFMTFELEWGRLPKSYLITSTEKLYTGKMMEEAMEKAGYRIIIIDKLSKWKVVWDTTTRRI